MSHFLAPSATRNEHRKDGKKVTILTRNGHQIEPLAMRPAHWHRRAPKRRSPDAWKKTHVDRKKHEDMAM